LSYTKYGKVVLYEIYSNLDTNLSVIDGMRSVYASSPCSDSLKQIYSYSTCDGQSIGDRYSSDYGFCAAESVRAVLCGDQC
jgi:hypothetical protein